jgi:hypothetical protein
MKKVAKIFLIGSVAAFALSLTGPGGELLWGILKPLGALLFGAFFITNLVANEYAKYDQEQKAKLALAAGNSVLSPAPAASRRHVETRTLTPVTVK